jgi:TetR/AcrR family transcriptional repressor of nem operon
MARSTFVVASRPVINRGVMEAIRTSIRSGPGRPTRQESSARRDLMLDVGARVIYEKGYHGTSIRDIVTEVGVPTGSFYNFFKSKEDFIVEALEYHVNIRYEEYSRFLAQESASPVKQIIEALGNSPDRISADKFTAIGMSIKVCGEVGNHIPALNQISNNMFARFRDDLARAISRAQAAGEIDKNKDALTLATFLLIAWTGYYHLTRDGNSTGNSLRESFLKILEQELLV